MNKLDRLDELRMRAEEALKRRIPRIEHGDKKDKSGAAPLLTISQVELLLENETLRIQRDRKAEELNSQRALFDQVPLPYLAFDDKGTVLFHNKAAETFIQPATSKTHLLSIYGMATHHSLNDFRELVEKAFRTGKEYEGYLELTDRKGRIGDYHVILTPGSKNEPGKTICSVMISSLHDHDNYYKNELRKKEKDYHELMSNISDGIFYTEKGILNSVNPSLALLLGYPAKQLEGKPLWELVTSSYRKEVRKLFTKPAPQNMRPSYDVKCIRQDGTVFWADLKIKHLAPGDKSFGTLSDITQRKLAENQLKESEAQLKQSNAAKDKLFSIISHDLKTPFSTLMGYTYLMMKDYRQYDEQKREAMTRSLYDITKQTFNMLENILIWSRSQTGGLPFAPRAFNILSLLAENIRLYTPTARSKNITLTLEESAEKLLVFADPEMIQTVVRNLVTNAIKFTPEKGHVTLGVIHDEDEKITVYVRDSGIGIDKNRKNELFRIDGNYSTRGTNDEKGTGLGLTVCKEFVEKNGGEIWADSSPGKGSTFSFTLYRKVEEL